MFAFSHPSRALLALTMAAALGAAATSVAQTTSGTAGGGSGIAGVGIDASRLLKCYVDADGVMHKQLMGDPSGQLSQQKRVAAQQAMHGELGKASALRKISLNRLEKALQEAGRGQLPDDMRYLAGLTRIQFVFFYPDSGDIVLAGPSEGWFEDLTGRVVGVNSGRPVLELEDLVVALRAYGPGKRKGPMIGCSIDPTPEGLAKMQQFLATVGRHATPADTQFLVDGLRTSLGLQKVSVLGISPNTHFAKVMVEADYRMKMIGIGAERVPYKKLVTYISKADPASANRNALQRWYFMPEYECLRVSEDRQAMEMVGWGVKLVGENEFVAANGQRSQAGRASRASTAFTKSFTQYYPEIAARSPVYAQLRNLIDMAVAAAFIQHEDFYGTSGWDMPLLGDESRFPVETHHAPAQVESVVTSVWKGSRLMTPIGGGVHIEAGMALQSQNVMPDEGGKVAEVRQKTELDHLKPGQWWWD
ncbi:MAG TPA: DUF1598 domain-containing protein [Pirellulales bacterium]|nr:DUF1598 domain-containing protein [Pirellulales bacterium]